MGHEEGCRDRDIAGVDAGIRRIADRKRGVGLVDGVRVIATAGGIERVAAVSRGQGMSADRQGARPEHCGTRNIDGNIADRARAIAKRHRARRCRRCRDAAHLRRQIDEFAEYAGIGGAAQDRRRGVAKIAGIANAIAVGVGLGRIGYGRAVVANIADTVAVGIGLIAIRHRITIVRGGANAVEVVVRRGFIAVANTDARGNRAPAAIFVGIRTENRTLRIRPLVVGPETLVRRIKRRRGVVAPAIPGPAKRAIVVRNAILDQ